MFPEQALCCINASHPLERLLKIIQAILVPRKYHVLHFLLVREST